MQSTDTRTDNLRRLNEMIRGIPAAMLTTVNETGGLHSRPMAALDRESDGALWFFTTLDSGTAREIRVNRNVNLAYVATGNARYVSVSGTADLVRDLAKVRELWHPSLLAWIPQGHQDPNLGLIRVMIQSVEFWESPSSALKKLEGFAPES